MCGFVPNPNFVVEKLCAISKSPRKRSRAGPEVIKLFSCSTQLSSKFILLINIKMPTIDGILTFIGMINTTYESLIARKICILRHFDFYEQLKFRRQSSSTFHYSNNKGADQTARMRRLVCAIVVRKPRRPRPIFVYYRVYGGVGFRPSFVMAMLCVLSVLAII